MAGDKHNFTEVKGKTVDFVELTVENDYYGITIVFEDQTALTFALESCIVTFPALEDFSAGESRVIEEYDPIQSAIVR